MRILDAYVGLSYLSIAGQHGNSSTPESPDVILDESYRALLFSLAKALTAEDSRLSYTVMIRAIP
jgi:hypothetical protein